jgi:predicted DNA-binding transcriptional regulator AlpA
MQIVKTLEKIVTAIEKQAVPDRLWSVDDIADYVGYHENFVYKMKDNPTFPRPVVLGKQPRWIPQEVKDWIKKQR